MKLLALEFSSSQRSVAVLNAAASGITCFEVVETGGLGPFGMIEQALRNAGLEREQIECIVVGLGPGSYTGIRSAIALAQGWQLARGTKLLGIGSDEVLAEQARTQGILGRVNVAIDAQRHEFYLETFEISAQRWHRLEPLHLSPLEHVQARAESGQIVVSPDASKLPGSRLLFPRAASLAILAQHRTDSVPGENLSPIYLRQTTFVKAPPSRVLPALLRLPNSDRLIVQREKVLDYLLNPAHADNGGKAAFFSRLGFTADTWANLALGLQKVGATGELIEKLETVHGTKYIVDGKLESMTAKDATVRTVWIVDREFKTPRLVTAYPAKFSA